MIYPLVIDLAEDGFPVTRTSGVLQFSTQDYYRWLKIPITKHDWDNAPLTKAGLDAH